ncbi:MAG: hypothetical protein IID35_10125 [Planctomycetes bacterium]|nr:hypothetical protein [Planctomycetota bacterium]
MKMHRSGLIQLGRRVVTCTLAVVSLVAYAGCVPVKFYKLDQDGQKNGEVGFEYWAPKSYLVVERNDDGATARVITVSDPSKPRVLEYQRTWGSTEVGFTSAKGIITEFNTKYDSKVPETITALAGAAKALPTKAGVGAGGPLENALEDRLRERAGLAGPAALLGSEENKSLNREIKQLIKELEGVQGESVKMYEIVVDANGNVRFKSVALP